MESTLVWIICFFIYAFFGWVCESIYCSLGNKKIINRGFLNGPICPIYGFGALAVITALTKYVHNPVLIFFYGMIITSILEYITSFVLEKSFKTTLWDYSKRFCNINGRVCLKNSLMFGAMSLIIMMFVHPFVVNIVNHIYPNTLLILSTGLILITLTDFISTTHALYDLNNKSAKYGELLTDLKAFNNNFKLMPDDELRLKIKSNVTDLIDKLEEKVEYSRIKEFENFEEKVSNLKGKYNFVSKHSIVHHRLFKAFPNMKSKISDNKNAYLEYLKEVIKSKA